MQMEVSIIILLLTLHFIADFVLQSDWMAIGKSKDWEPLWVHTLVYSTAFILGLLLFSPLTDQVGILAFFLVTWGTHTVQDYITSRINAKLWQAEQRHWFFVGIGFDQLLHYITLIFTYKMVQ